MWQPVLLQVVQQSGSSQLAGVTRRGGGIKHISGDNQGIRPLFFYQVYQPGLKGQMFPVTGFYCKILSEMPESHV